MATKNAAAKSAKAPKAVEVEMVMSASIDKIDPLHQFLVIRIPMQLPLQPSSTGKSLTVATTNGFTQLDQTLKVEGKTIKVNINAIAPVR
jgi:hypothetical protein